MGGASAAGGASVALSCSRWITITTKSDSSSIQLLMWQSLRWVGGGEHLLTSSLLPPLLYFLFPSVSPPSWFCFCPSICLRNYTSAWTPLLLSLCHLFFLSSHPSTPPPSLTPPTQLLDSVCDQRACDTNFLPRRKVGLGVERPEMQTREDAAASELFSFQTLNSDWGKGKRCGVALNILDARLTTSSLNRSPTLHPCGSRSHLHVKQILRFWIRGSGSRRTSGGAATSASYCLRKWQRIRLVSNWRGDTLWRKPEWREPPVRKGGGCGGSFLTLLFFPVLLSSGAPPCCLLNGSVRSAVPSPWASQLMISAVRERDSRRNTTCDSEQVEKSVQVQGRQGIPALGADAAEVAKI